MSSTTRSGKEERITWRGSVSDLVTDLVCALTDEQLDRLIVLLETVDRNRKRQRSEMETP
jgi:hypothetical protein